MGRHRIYWTHGIVILLLAGLVYVLFFYRLAERDLWGSHEARAAQNAGSMLHYLDWGLPRLTDERPDLQKPPLYYWLVAGLARLRGGVDAWAVRLSAALAATLCVAAVALVLWRRGRPAAALFAALLLVTAQHFTWLARTARVDMPLALCVTVAVLSTGLQRRWMVVGFVAMAAGLLLKGPVGAVLPLAVVLGDRLVEWWLERRHSVPTPSPPEAGGEGRGEGGCPSVAGGLPPSPPPPLPPKRGKRGGRETGGMMSLRSFAWGLPLALMLAAPWFIYADRRTHGEFSRVFFWYHNVQRAAGGAEELAVHPWWYYGPRLLVDALPASLVLVPAMVWFLRGGRWRMDREARFGLVWLVAVVGVLSCARFKRADYLLPAYPGLALFLGCVAERLWLAAAAWRRRALIVGSSLLVAGAVVGWGYVLHVEHPRIEPHRELRTFARAVRAVAPRPEEVLFFRVECHPLAFHLGRRINSLLEWENLDVWAGRPESVYVVMTPDVAAEWPRRLTAGTLEEVLRNAEGHERPLVLMRTRPRVGTPHAAPREQAADRVGADQPGAAGARPGGAT